MAVPWKNGAAPRVTPGIRVVIVMSDCDERVAIRDSPGEGFASVLMMTESFSAWKGFAGFSNVPPPLTLTACRMGSDHIPRPPPIACSLRFDRVGISLCAQSQYSALEQE